MNKIRIQSRFLSIFNFIWNKKWLYCTYNDKKYFLVNYLHFYRILTNPNERLLSTFSGKKYTSSFNCIYFNSRVCCWVVMLCSQSPTDSFWYTYSYMQHLYHYYHNVIHYHRHVYLELKLSYWFWRRQL